MGRVANYAAVMFLVGMLVIVAANYMAHALSDSFNPVGQHDRAPGQVNRPVHGGYPDHGVRPVATIIHVPSHFELDAPQRLRDPPWGMGALDSSQLGPIKLNMRERTTAARCRRALRWLYRAIRHPDRQPGKLGLVRAAVWAMLKFSDEERERRWGGR